MRFTIKQLTLLKQLPLLSTQTRPQCTNISADVLSGVKILDLTRIIAGPFCTMILSDMGAEVIKIEKPGSGDEARKWGPPYINGTSESCYFASVNRNKKSICIDIKSDEGKKLIYELATISDVLVENYVPGTLDNYKLGYNDLRVICPHLIYCSITGYGSEGPYMKKPGYDVIAASVGGLLNITGPTNGEPVKVGVAVTDLSTGLYAHGAILAALLYRNKTGKGQKIDCNLLSTQVASLINIGSNYLNSGIEGQKWGSAHQSLVPYEMFKTKDDYITLGAGSDSQFEDLCSRIGLKELIDNKKYKTNALRVKNRVELINTLKSVIQTKTKREWMEIFADSSFPCGPVNKISEVFADTHVQAIGLVETVEHPKIGKVRMVGPPVRYSETHNKVRSAPPLLGEHTDEILQKYLGYNEDHIEKLRISGVVQ